MARTKSGGGASTSTVNTYTKAQRGAVVTLASSGNSVNIDMSLANNFNLVMTENTTLEIPTNLGSATASQSGVIRVTQGAGPYTLGFDTAFWKAPGASYGAISVTAGMIDEIIYYYDNVLGIASISIRNNIS